MPCQTPRAVSTRGSIRMSCYRPASRHTLLVTATVSKPSRSRRPSSSGDKAAAAGESGGTSLLAAVKTKEAASATSTAMGAPMETTGKVIRQLLQPALATVPKRGRQRLFGGGSFTGGDEEAAQAVVEPSAEDDDLAESASISQVSNSIVSAGGLAQYVYGARVGPPTFRALVLDSAYRPINVVTWFRAFNMAYQERADVLSYYPNAFAWSGQGPHPLAAIVRVHAYVDINDVNNKVPCNRRNVLTRDRYSCVYCGCHRDLTLDHVLPVSRGGRDSWTNLVAACMTCNQRKGSQTLNSLGWRLKKTPWEPTPWELGSLPGLSNADVMDPPHPEWGDYLSPFRERLETINRQREEAGEWE